MTDLTPVVRQTKDQRVASSTTEPAGVVRPKIENNVSKSPESLTPRPNVPTTQVSVTPLAHAYHATGHKTLPAIAPYTRVRSGDFRSSIMPIYCRPLAPPASIWAMDSINNFNHNTPGGYVTRQSLGPARPRLLASSHSTDAALAVKVFKAAGGLELRVPTIVVTPPSPPRTPLRIASTASLPAMKDASTSKIKPTFTLDIPIRTAVRPSSVPPPSQAESPPRTPPSNSSTAPLSSVDRLSPVNMGDVPRNRWGPDLSIQRNNLLSPDSARSPSKRARRPSTPTRETASRASSAPPPGSPSPLRRRPSVSNSSPSKNRNRKAQDEARSIIRGSLRNDHLPRPKANQPLFRPADARRLWYLGFVEHWSHLQANALTFWQNSHCQKAFDKIQDSPVAPPRGPDPSLTKESHDSEIYKSYFQRDVLEVINSVFNLLQSMKKAPSPPGELFLAESKEEDLGNEDLIWKPTFVMKARMRNQEEQIRMIGHIEYLGGRRGALTWAVKELAQNTWGSLRCVLGTIALLIYYQLPTNMPTRRDCTVHAPILYVARLHCVRR